MTAWLTTLALLSAALGYGLRREHERLDDVTWPLRWDGDDT